MCLHIYMCFYLWLIYVIIKTCQNRTIDNIISEVEKPRFTHEKVFSSFLFISEWWPRHRGNQVHQNWWTSLGRVCHVESRLREEARDFSVYRTTSGYWLLQTAKGKDQSFFCFVLYFVREVEKLKIELAL